MLPFAMNIYESKAGQTENSLWEQSHQPFFPYSLNAEGGHQEAIVVMQFGLLKRIASLAYGKLHRPLRGYCTLDCAYP